MTEMPDLELLVCVRCIKRVDATCDDAAGWILVERSVLAGDPDDDRVWVCPMCSTPVEREAFMPPIDRLRLSLDTWPNNAA
jgi:hypothetical protein